MPRRRLIQCLVCVSAPIEMHIPAALGVVRAALRNSDPTELGLFTVSPIPRDRMVKRRRPPIKSQPMPLFDFMESAR